MNIQQIKTNPFSTHVSLVGIMLVLTIMATATTQVQSVNAQDAETGKTQIKLPVTLQADQRTELA